MFFSVADGVDRGLVNTLMHKELLHSVSTPVTQAKVVFRASSFVTMPFDCKFHAGVLL